MLLEQYNNSHTTVPSIISPGGWVEPEKASASRGPLASRPGGRGAPQLKRGIAPTPPPAHFLPIPVAVLIHALTATESSNILAKPTCYCRSLDMSDSSRPLPHRSSVSSSTSSQTNTTTQPLQRTTAQSFLSRVTAPGTLLYQHSQIQPPGKTWAQETLQKTPEVMNNRRHPSSFQQLEKVCPPMSPTTQTDKL